MTYIDVGTSAATYIPCAYCGAWHTGTCPRIKAIDYNSDGTIRRVEFHEPPAVFTGIEDIKSCIRCGHPALFFAILPYSSKWDGEVICGDCVVELIDPAIAEAFASLEGKAE